MNCNFLRALPLLAGLMLDSAPALAADAPELADAITAFQAGSYHDAAALFRKAAASDPRNVLVWQFLGNSLHQDHDFAGAKQA
jgi:Flp pilus assembly protein TadD